MSRPAAAALALFLTACAGENPPRVVAHGEPPALLSEWGVVVAQGGALRLGEGVLPYDLNTPLFSDYAQKLRTVWMPAGRSARYDAEGDWDFPVGTILTKTFYYPEAADGSVLPAEPTPAFDGERLDLGGVRLMETRLLVRQAGGWEAYPYVWDEALRDARLKRTGDMARLTLASDGMRRDFTYVVPDANQCAGCHRPDHSSRRIRPIGPKTRHLNREIAYGEGVANQLEAWTRAGFLTGAPAPETAPRLAAWDREDSGDIEARARAYLDVNCGHCHNPAGAADTSGLFLDVHTTDPRRLGRCKPPVAAGRGTGDRAFSIVPGRPDDSILVYRMRTDDPGAAMPELGRAIVHTEGVDLIESWIAGLAGECGVAGQAGNAT